MKPPAVLLIGKNRHEATLASAALYCAGARIVTAKPDLALLVDIKALPKRLNVPVVAIVPPREKRRALIGGVDAAYAERSATKLYRTTPLRALWQHPPYFHDGSAGTLIDVVNHYDSLFGLRLTANQKTDLVEYLKTL